MENYFTISEVCSKLNTETYTLRYLEKVMELDISRDDFQNRIYTKDDVETLEDIIMLKNQGLNYKAIKIVLKNTKKNTSSFEDETAATINKDIEEEESVSSLELEEYNSNNIELFKNILQETMNETMAPMNNEIKDLKIKTSQILEQNKNLRVHLEKEQERHFKELDQKLTKWREESTKKKSFFNKFFKK